MQLITLAMKFIHSTYMYNLADSGFFKNFLYQGGVKCTVSCVFEDLKFKISEGYKQIGSFKLEVLIHVPMTL